jgi:hypothetical protein
MRRPRALVLSATTVALAVSLTVAGCSSSGGGGGSSASGTTTAEANPVGDIPDNQVYVPYSPPDGSFTVEVPEGWARTDAGDTVSFTDKLNTVTVQELTGRPQPTPDSVRTGELAGAAARNGAAGTVEQVTLPAGPAIHATYSADATPDPVTGRTVRDDVELYVFWKDGTEVLLTLSGPHGADNVDPWKKISTSFAWNR